jgi:hypothetical protein
MGVTRYLVIAALALGCQSNVGQAAVSLGMKIDRQSPGDASVFIDEEYIGPLGYVAAHGVRLPVGEHRISVKREGFFPWDRLVVADRQPIRLDVKLDPIPD